MSGERTVVVSTEWPASVWECAAPESYLLLHFSKPDAKQALKLGFVELIARRALRLAQVQKRGFMGRVKQLSVLVAGDGGQRLPETVKPLMAVYETEKLSAFEQQSGGSVYGAEIGSLARKVMASLGGTVEGYAARVLRPALVGRGWVAEERYRMLGFIPRRRWALTRAGIEAQADLLWRVEYGNREIGGLVQRDPARAIAFVGLSGAALLLMSDALPHLQLLREQIEAARRGTGPDGGWYGTGGVSAGSSEAAGAGVSDLPGLDAALAPDVLASLDALDTVAGLDLSALDGIDSALSAVDAGVDAGASGGDGGGGDGGGGGGGE